MDIKNNYKQITTVEEFDALLKAYKVSNPVKYEAKEKLGEFAKFRATLVGGEKVEKPVVEKPKK